MSSLYSIVAMAVIRYSSIVKYNQSWHLDTKQKFFASQCVHVIWGSSICMAIPPIFGVGDYVSGEDMIR